MYFLLSSPFLPSALQTKLLYLERDKRELERSLHLLKQSSERAATERENASKKLTAQIHQYKKDVAKLNEVRPHLNLPPQHLFQIEHTPKLIALTPSSAMKPTFSPKFGSFLPTRPPRSTLTVKIVLLIHVPLDVLYLE